MIFKSTLSQMMVLALFVLIGFILVKSKAVKSEASTVIAKLENNVFIPALVASTFLEQFTIATLSSFWKLLLFSLIIELAIIVITIFVVKLISKDSFLRKIYTYGLSFSNFGFMGNAVVKALFPEYFVYYLTFTLPLWILIYVWGVPELLMDDGKNGGVANRLKRLINPMLIALLIGAIIGISGVKLPKFITSVVFACGECMSPLAMILTGITFGGLDLKKVLSNVGIYVASFLRLIVYPFVICGVALLVNKFIIQVPQLWFLCLTCSACMPLGLNTVVVPAAYGKDTSVPAGMALVSHALSVVTIPLVFSVFV